MEGKSRGQGMFMGSLMFSFSTNKIVVRDYMQIIANISAQKNVVSDSYQR